MIILIGEGAVAFEKPPIDNEMAPGKPPARIFVALKMSPEVALELTRIARTLERLPVRFIAPADIHLTLVPPWNETAIPRASDRLSSVAEKATPFILTFRRLCYGPQPRRPRLLWAECEGGEKLAALQASLSAAFGKTDERPFVPHVTVARIRGNGSILARRCPIDLFLGFSQKIETVELMQSPQAGGVGYRVLTSLRLGRHSAC
jgi:2'-5' RNA ligase